MGAAAPGGGLMNGGWTCVCVYVRVLGGGKHQVCHQAHDCITTAPQLLWPGATVVRPEGQGMHGEAPPVE